METIKMVRGNMYADIANTPETIQTAIADGWVEVKEEPKKDKVENADKPAEKPLHAKTNKGK